MTDEQKIAGALAHERYRAILASPEAEGRQSSARHIALSCDLDVDIARALLATVPRDSHESIGARARETIISTH